MRLVAVLVCAMLALAGCGVPGLGGPDADTRMRQQAQDILARWEAAYATAKKLTTVPLDAVDGPVTAPAWELTFADIPVRALVPAVAPGDALVVPEASWDPYNTPAGLPMQKVTSTSDGRTLTISFTGARDGADKPCGADYWAESASSEHAIVVMLHTRARVGGGGCNDIGYPRQVTLDLPQPFLGRMVLAGQLGRPVVVTRQ